jgi:HlyD family secretion protein
MCYAINRWAVCFVCVLFSGCQSETRKFHGYVEGEYQYIAPTSSGLLKGIYVQKGAFIPKGTPLFALEDVDLKVSIENTKAEIRQAKSALRQARQEYERAKKLVKPHLISQSEFDQKESAYDVGQAKLDGFQQSLITAEKKLKDSAPVAIEDAYVEDTFFVVGEFIQSGKPVVSLLRPQKTKIRFFVPQSQLAKIVPGKPVTISYDGCTKAKKGKITYISKQMEYTPPVIYSTDARQKMVFMVEAKTDQVDLTLHPGLPVDIQIEEQ